jgi:Domain of unknown function (DUF4386)
VTAISPLTAEPSAAEGRGGGTRLLDRPSVLGHVAGLLYVALAALGGWAELGVRGAIRVPGDAAATAANIVADETLFRLALGADILMAVVFVVLGLTLFRLLHRDHGRWATALLVFVSVGAGGILVNLVFQVGALLAATDPTYAAAFGPDGADALALLLLDLHGHGYVLGGVFFGLWLLPLGLVALRSRYFPRALGVLVVVGVAAWVADPVIAFTVPDAPTLLRQVVKVPTTLAELSLLLYLVVRGVAPGGRSASITAPGRTSS